MRGSPSIRTGQECRARKRDVPAPTSRLLHCISLHCISGRTCRGCRGDRCGAPEHSRVELRGEVGWNGEQRGQPMEKGDRLASSGSRGAESRCVPGTVATMWLHNIWSGEEWRVTVPPASHRPLSPALGDTPRSRHAPGGAQSMIYHERRTAAPLDTPAQGEQSSGGTGEHPSSITPVRNIASGTQWLPTRRHPIAAVWGAEVPTRRQSQRTAGYSGFRREPKCSMAGNPAPRQLRDLRALSFLAPNRGTLGGPWSALPGEASLEGISGPA